MSERPGYNCLGYLTFYTDEFLERSLKMEKKWKWSRFLIAFVVGMLVGSPVFLMLKGCGGGPGEIATGAAIGITASSAMAQAQVDAQKTKAALVAELQVVRMELVTSVEAGDEVRTGILEDRLKKLEDKKFGVDVAEYGTTKVMEGLSRDLSSSDPEKQRGNIMWGVDGILGLYALWAARKNRASSKVINRLRGEATPEESAKIYAINKAVNRRLIP